MCLDLVVGSPEENTYGFHEDSTIGHSLSGQQSLVDTDSAHIVDGDQRVDQVVPTRESDQTGHTRLPHQGVSR